MRSWVFWRNVNMTVIAMLVMAVSSGTVFAVTSTSPNYQVTETDFGSSSSEESCSGEFCARASIGSIEGGRSEAPESTAEFGQVTTDVPSLEVIVDPGVSNLGVLTTEETASKTTTVRIRNYLSGGYVLQITGDPPKYDDHTLATPANPTASDPGTEQFGINAATNTSPEIGADPQQIPSQLTSFGEVTDDYLTPNLFKYSSGEVVARSLTESGRTDFTISMIVNISNATPAGKYNGEFSAVVIPVY